MNQSPETSEPVGASEPPEHCLRKRMIARWPAAPFLLPFVVFVVASAFEPSHPRSGAPASDSWLAIDFSYYPLVYMLKIALTLVAISLVWPGYKQFPWRVSPLALLVGVVGAVAYVGLCEWGIVARILGALGLDSWVDAGARAGFNPLDEVSGGRVMAYGFLAIRLAGLALVAPFVEEFFLRGFLLRFIAHPNWQGVPPADLPRWTLVSASFLPLLWHPPSEGLAVIVWFSLVTWLMTRTKNIWDCVVAHAVTNGLLGGYVIATGHWWLM